MSGLRTCRAHQLAQVQSEEPRWLIEELWSEQAVGIVGGEPKCLKSFLSLEMALALATGRPCLRQFKVHRPGPVLLYAAEDSLRIVYQRLLALARGRGDPPLEEIPLHVITERQVRLDLISHRDRLLETVDQWRPRLLILDPFVRLHDIDENHSKEVAPILGFLRSLQRQFHTAVLVVHHAKKGGGKGRAGQELRGSSEFHAWGDSNLYLRRRGEELHLTTEHRGEPGRDNLELELVTQDDTMLLQVTERAPPCEQSSPRERLLRTLTDALAPLPARRLREECRMRAQTLGDILRELQREGTVVHAIGRARQQSSLVLAQ